MIEVYEWFFTLSIILSCLAIVVVLYYVFLFISNITKFTIKLKNIIYDYKILFVKIKHIEWLVERIASHQIEDRINNKIKKKK